MSKKFSPLKHARNFRSCDPSAVLLTHGSFSLYSEVLFYSTTIPVLICVMTYRKPKNTNKWLVNRAPSSIAKSARLMSIFIFIGHRRCAYYIFRRWVFFIYFFLSIAFPARPYIRLPQPVPISKGRRGGCYEMLCMKRAFQTCIVRSGSPHWFRPWAQICYILKYFYRNFKFKA